MKMPHNRFAKGSDEVHHESDERDSADEAIAKDSDTDPNDGEPESVEQPSRAEQAELLLDWARRAKRKGDRPEVSAECTKRARASKDGWESIEEMILHGASSDETQATLKARMDEARPSPAIDRNLVSLLRPAHQ